MVDRKSSANHKVIKESKHEICEYPKQIYYKSRNRYLIPKGGTTSWLKNCDKRNYRVCGYHEHIVDVIKISNDSRVEIADYTQPNGNKEEVFFTSVTFYKKELDNHSIYAPHIYDRAYSIYYPYGTRFNCHLLKKIGYALSKLINDARDLNDTLINQKKLMDISNQQRQLIELFINGTNDIMAVEKIIGYKKIKFIDGIIREARLSKDWLPHLVKEVPDDVIELSNQKVLKK